MNEYRVKDADQMITYGWGDTEEEAIDLAKKSAKMYGIPFEGMVLVKYNTVVTIEEVRTL